VLSVYLDEDFFFSRNMTASSSLRGLWERDVDQREYSQSVPLQVKSKEEFEKIEIIGETVEYVLVTGFWIPFFLQVFLSVSMSMIWNIFNTLQIITNFPLLQVLMPANVMLVQSHYQSIVNMELVPKEALYEFIFGEKLEDKKDFFALSYKNTFEAAGFGSSILITVAFSLFSVLVLLLIIVLMCLIRCTLWHKMPDIVKTGFNKAERKIMFNSILRTMIQTYLETCIATMISLQLRTGTQPLTWEDKINTLFSIASVPYILAFPPAVTYYLLHNQ